MSVSTDGQLCYGIRFEEGEEFPWDDYEDLDEWWLAVNNFENPIENPFDEEGNHLPEFSGAHISKYFKERRNWLQENPCPITLVNYCSISAPMFILAVPMTTVIASGGYPTELNLLELIGLEQSLDLWSIIMDFCNKHDIVPQENPTWWLSSFWEQ